jgi:hypothetical protein
VKTFKCPRCADDVLVALNGGTGRFIRLAPRPHPKGHLALEFSGVRRPPQIRYVARGGRYLEHVCRPHEGPRAA